MKSNLIHEAKCGSQREPTASPALFLTTKTKGKYLEKITKANQASSPTTILSENNQAVDRKSRENFQSIRKWQEHHVTWLRRNWKDIYQFVSGIR